jgi:Type I phosphodiesterase / nucleotide pyrophosphatase
MQSGASTLHAHTDPTVSVTLPNHTGMVTGRSVDGVDGHRVTGNSYVARTVHEDRGAYTASIFDVAHDHGLFTMMAASKNKFWRLSESWNPGAPDVTGDDDGDNKIDVVAVAEQDDSVTTTAVLDVIDALTTVNLGNSAGALLFVHLRAADNAGHSSGFSVDNSAYMNAVAADDIQLTRIVDAVIASPVLCGRTSIFVTTDHGGTGTNHSDATNPENTTIPFIAFGPLARAGADLEALNADGHLPIRNIDVGQLALEHLGLPAVDGATQDADFDLRTR